MTLAITQPKVSPPTPNPKLCANLDDYVTHYTNRNLIVPDELLVALVRLDIASGKCRRINFEGNVYPYIVVTLPPSSSSRSENNQVYIVAWEDGFGTIIRTTDPQNQKVRAFLQYLTDRLVVESKR